MGSDQEGNGGESEDLVDPLTQGDDEHLLAITERDPPPAIEQIVHALTLIRYVLDRFVQPPAETFSNDLSCAVCLARAYRQLRAALLLAHFGYYSEVPSLLRGAYESASLSRYLAHQPEKADRWLREGEWFPDRDVRSWFETAGKDYARFYREMTKLTHPTARSCSSLLEFHGSLFELRLDTVVDRDTFEARVREVAATAVFVVFCVRNALVDPDVLPPAWHQKAAELVKQTHPETNWSHLDRDWAEEERRFEELLARVRNIDELNDAIQESPRSWENLKSTTKDSQDSEPKGRTSGDEDGLS